LAEHRRVLRAAFAAHGGVEVDTEGDAFFVAFPTASGALDAARDGLEALATGPITVRIGVHTGTPLVTGEGYVGEDVHRAARIAASGHGGQVLVSETTAALAEADLTDLGEHRFKDLARPERVFQLGGTAFPPIRSLSPSNLPVPTTPFLGRERELARVGELLGDASTRLVTLTGPGGTGKTRLAIQAAAEASDAFPGGLWWVALAPLADPTLVASEIADALGVEVEGSLVDAVHARSGGRRTLLLLDNAEHLLPDLADEVTPLTRDGATLLVTSRERLHLEAEREFAVPAMTAADAEAFLLDRAEALGVPLEPSAALRELAERLDRLPLAMQLAVARLRLFSVDQLLERLSTALDLAGHRDADPRQRTLRATIGWSYDLLAEEERALLRSMSVFAGGGTIDAVEAISGTDLEVLLSLVDKSLVRRRDDAPEPRFWLLETIRGFALEHVEAAGEAEAIREAHARWYGDRIDALATELRNAAEAGPTLSAMDPEIDNVRAALTWASAAGARDALERLAGGLANWFTLRGLNAEARRWLDDAYDHPSGNPAGRSSVLRGLTWIAYRQGDYERALDVAEEEVPLARELGVEDDVVAVTTSVGHALTGLGRLDEATAAYDEALAAARRTGKPRRIASALVNRGDMAIIAGRYDEAVAYLEEAVEYGRRHGDLDALVVGAIDLANVSFLLGRDDAVEEHVAVAMRAIGEIGPDHISIALLLLAGVAMRRGDLAMAARYLGASEGVRERTGYQLEPGEHATESVVHDGLRDALTDAEVRRAYEEGTALDLAGALELVPR
jgi:predicted ATPase